MNRLVIFLLLSSLAIVPVFGQRTLSGAILDSKSGESLPFVNIGIIGKNIGTVSSPEGEYSLEIPEGYESDSLRVSMIGYQSKTILIDALESDVQSISLVPETYALEEVVLKDKTWKTKTLGNKSTSKGVSMYFTSNDYGSELGVRIKIKDSPTYLENFNFQINGNEYDTVMFRVNVYDMEKGKPGKNITGSNIIITETIREGQVNVDLEPYNIVAEDDFLISLEWIFGGDSKGLFFSGVFLGKPLYYRKASQGEWTKVGKVGPGMNVRVSY